jgi:methylmalonyl-CoA/ethylmalonyl-CoA epimerase
MPNFNNDRDGTPAVSLALAGARFHHVGVAARELDVEERFFAMLGYAREREDVVDERQGVRARFLVGGGPRIELLVDLPGSGGVGEWLKRGITLYHLAYEVDDLTSSGERLGALGAKLIVGPLPAIAFDHRPIEFWLLPTMMLVELIGR